jgi:hypothetical protein
MSAVRHGTRAGYNTGCRCEACSKANAAHGWALRKIGRWQSPITEAIYPAGASLLDGTVVSGELLRSVLLKQGAKLKMQALMAMYEETEAKR